MSTNKDTTGPAADPARMYLDVPREWSGNRLDKFLARAISKQGLRFVRFKWQDLQVRVNEIQANKGCTVYAGDSVSFEPLGEQNIDSLPAACLRAKVRLVHKDRDFAAIYKPCGLHTESPGLRGQPSLQAMLGQILPDKDYLLLNRLDLETSGLVLLASTQEAKKKYLSLQEQGLVSKQYLALVHGQVQASLYLDQGLDTARRRKVRILRHNSADSLRRTRARLIVFLPGSGLSLLWITILKGARHQIRAHLAYAGHPIYGDQLYGAARPGAKLFLHHFRVSLPEFSAACLPGWSLNK